MTLTKTVQIAGCSKELGNWAYVDLREPAKIGHHPNHPEQLCKATPLKRNVLFDVTVTGGVIDDEKHGKYAEVLINCPATDCPHHK